MTLHRVPSRRNLQRLHRQNQNPEPSLLSFSPPPPCVFSQLILFRHNLFSDSFCIFFFPPPGCYDSIITRSTLNIPIFNAGGSLPARLLNPSHPPSHSPLPLRISDYLVVNVQLHPFGQACRCCAGATQHFPSLHKTTARNGECGDADSALTFEHLSTGENATSSNRLLSQRGAGGLRPSAPRDELVAGEKRLGCGCLLFRCRRRCRCQSEGVSSPASALASVPLASRRYRGCVAYQRALGRVD